MAGKREEWRMDTLGKGRLWLVFAAPRGRVVARNLSDHDARQIAHEHNMHERMLDALKLALDVLGDFKCENFTGTATSISDLIAEAEKGD